MEYSCLQYSWGSTNSRLEVILDVCRNRSGERGRPTGAGQRRSCGGKRHATGETRPRDRVGNLDGGRERADAECARVRGRAGGSRCCRPDTQRSAASLLACGKHRGAGGAGSLLAQCVSPPITIGRTEADRSSDMIVWFALRKLRPTIRESTPLAVSYHAVAHLPRDMSRDSSRQAPCS